MSLLGILSSDEDVIASTLPTASKKYLLSQREEVYDIIAKSRSFGQTISVLTGDNVDVRLRDVIGQLMSAAHIRHYSKITCSGIPTGFAGLESFDGLRGYRSVADIRLWSSMLQLFVGQRNVHDIKFLNFLSRSFLASQQRTQIVEGVQIFLDTLVETLAFRRGVSNNLEVFGKQEGIHEARVVLRDIIAETFPTREGAQVDVERSDR